MKKFITDNIAWLVLIALVLAGFAVYKIVNSNDGKVAIIPKAGNKAETDAE